MIYQDLKEILNLAKCESCLGQGRHGNTARFWECFVCEGKGFDVYHHSNNPDEVVGRLHDVLDNVQRT